MIAHKIIAHEIVQRRGVVAPLAARDLGLEGLTLIDGAAGSGIAHGTRTVAAPFAWVPDFPFLPFPSKDFNLFPNSLPNISLHFQKLQKISANLDLSMGYGRLRPEKTSGSQAAGGSAEASVRPDFPFLPFPSKGFNLFSNSLPIISLHFQKLQKISAIRDLSMGYGQLGPEKTSGSPAAGGSAEASVRPRAAPPPRNALNASNARAGDTPDSFRFSFIHILIAHKGNNVKKTSGDQNLLGAVAKQRIVPSSNRRASASDGSFGFDPLQPISPAPREDPQKAAAGGTRLERRERSIDAGAAAGSLSTAKA